MTVRLFALTCGRLGVDMAAMMEGETGRQFVPVPTFLIAQQYVVSGAQPTETWDKVIAEISGQAAE